MCKFWANVFLPLNWTLLHWFLLSFFKLQNNFQGVHAESLMLKNANDCPDAPNPMPLLMDVKILKNFDNKTQLLEFSMDVPFDINTNTLAVCKIELNTIGTTWMPIVKMEDKKGMCNLFTANGGAMWPQVQKEIGLTPHSCPIPKGKYHTKTFFLNLTKEKLPGTPPGKYRAIIEVREKSNNRVLMCKMFDIEDKV